MKKLTKPLLLFFLIAFSCTSIVQAQPKRYDFGQQEFDSRCASCHGKDGKGNGWLTYFITIQPPDLTQLAKKNGGILPVDRLYMSISGDGVAIHGPSDMPAWGRTYRNEAPDLYLGIPYDSEVYSRGRILMLIEYINRLQVK